MRNPEAFRNCPRLRAHSFRAVKQEHRRACDVIFILQKRKRDRAVHASAHREHKFILHFSHLKNILPQINAKNKRNRLQVNANYVIIIFNVNLISRRRRKIEKKL
jgi:hypothetical protein